VHTVGVSTDGHGRRLQARTEPRTGVPRSRTSSEWVIHFLIGVRHLADCVNSGAIDLACAEGRRVQQQQPGGVRDYEVPDREWSLPAVQALRDMVAAIVGWDNDLTSMEKEVHRARERGLPAVQNLVAVLAQDGGLSLGEAVQVTAAMRDHAVARFLRLRDDVAVDGSPELGRYANGLGQWIRGYLDYSRLSPRYTDARNQDDGAVAADSAAGWVITDRLPVTDVVLPELPSISWWSRP